MHMHPLFNCCHSEHSPLCKKKKKRKKEPPEKSWILENAPKNKLCTRDTMEALLLVKEQNDEGIQDESSFCSLVTIMAYVKNILQQVGTADSKLTRYRI